MQTMDKIIYFSEILLLDEPTTGLDSYTTRNLIKSLSEIAHAGKIVVMTVHQPRSDVFKLFDKICLLSMGEVVYFGRGNEMVDYFGELGYPCPIYANPLDHFGNYNSELLVLWIFKLESFNIIFKNTKMIIKKGSKRKVISLLEANVK